MTNEEAIEVLQREFPDFEGEDKNIARLFPEVVTALNMAIKALEKQKAISELQPPTDNWENYADRLSH